jgi:hypothetical protein
MSSYKRSRSPSPEPEPSERKSKLLKILNAEGMAITSRDAATEQTNDPSDSEMSDAPHEDEDIEQDARDISASKSPSPTPTDSTTVTVKTTSTAWTAINAHSKKPIKPIKATKTSSELSSTPGSPRASSVVKDDAHEDYQSGSESDEDDSGFHEALQFVNGLGRGYTEKKAQVNEKSAVEDGKAVTTSSDDESTHVPRVKKSPAVDKDGKMLSARMAVKQSQEAKAAAEKKAAAKTKKPIKQEKTAIPDVNDDSETDPDNDDWTEETICKQDGPKKLIPFKKARTNAKVGKVQPKLLHVLCWSSDTLQKRELHFGKIPTADIDWNNKKHITAINTWRTQIWSRAGLKVKKVVLYHPDEEDWIQMFCHMAVAKGLKRRIKMPSNQDVNDWFNKFFEGRRLTNKKGEEMEPREKRSYASLASKTGRLQRELNEDDTWEAVCKGNQDFKFIISQEDLKSFQERKEALMEKLKVKKLGHQELIDICTEILDEKAAEKKAKAEAEAVAETKDDVADENKENETDATVKDDVLDDDAGVLKDDKAGNEDEDGQVKREEEPEEDKELVSLETRFANQNKKTDLTASKHSPKDEQV